ncbi:hypothetical protein TKWG_17740 [Advenella kashmirensis WT001]|uniref:Tripartite tricarboxylate transporter substrate binding protein BugD n=1 Tax=Advenella kashmirensis (strain DSM 17095 / LMG 22695 / WT001) TaxID=1036672 RepID=I3UEK2_ADVKW|nr:tripartite tricarboxylate transporter substrate-binding protein [Advenella kashmirensis]AFK63440.1 hypothetical protein TKWG_17740 [Advenella kashmirensis WT001]
MHNHATRINLGFTLLAGLFAATAATTALADYPEKSITIVVPFSAGGPSDKIARDVAEALREPMGQPIVIENRLGAGGTIGTARVARAKNDGYTLLVHHIGLATAHSLYKDPGYQIEDLEFLGLINEAPSTLISKPALAANDFAQLKKYIAEKDSAINLANAGVGSASHLCSLMLQSALNSKMTFVPYKGTAPAMTDLMGGQIDIMCEQATNSIPQIESKKVKVYGVSSMKRMGIPALTAVPTLDEAGLSGFNFSVWHGLYAPKGTPRPIVEKINAALRVALKNPELIKRQEALGISIVNDDRLSSEGHKKFFDKEAARWSGVIKSAGIQPE